ncbi:hypothetical protein KC866_02180 [Patescibacteria group bacterium]|nr:hypothetical protein [Patescibacteria group bacterium]
MGNFNLTWLIISIVIISNVFLFSFLSRDVSKYVNSIEEKRTEQYRLYE